MLPAEVSGVKGDDYVSKDEYEGYYCLLIAILCDLDAAEAQKMYKYGPNHPLCQKILKKKVKLPEVAKQEKEQTGYLMKEFLQEGYTFDAIADAFGCYPSTVRRWIKKIEEKTERKSEESI